MATIANLTIDQGANFSATINLNNLDATDGLAAAVCHFFNRDNLSSGKRFSGWKSFLNQNPHKIKKV